MEIIKTFLESIPSRYITGALIIIIVAGALILWSFLARARFKKNLKKVRLNPEKFIPVFRQKYSPPSILRKSGLIEKFIQKNGPEILSLTGIDDIWVANLQMRKRKKDFQRVLKYAPEKGLFKCFLISLEKKNLAPLLFTWLEESKDFLHMRKVAMAGIGEPFNSRDAYEIFKEKLAEIREMAGDPEWPSRYFAVKILLNDRDDRSIRAIWDAFEDPHPLIRKTVGQEYLTEDGEKLYGKLFQQVTGDPAFEVRKAAWQRIQSEFPDLYIINAKKLTEEEIFHVLELLRPDSKENESFALNFLGAPNLELRYTAASFLEQCGTLKRLCLETDLGDREALERNYRLLEKASEVKVTSFLSAVRDTNNPASLLICARILAKAGERANITALAKKVFSHFKNTPEEKELYRYTVGSVSERGAEDSLKLLDRELIKWKEDREIIELLIEALPERGDFFYTDTLLTFLKNPDFKAKDALRATLKHMSRPLVLQEVFKILKAGREAYPHPVRIQALKLLGEMGVPYCLQTILENLFTLPVREAREFTKVLAGFPADLFNDKVTRLMEGPDAKVRAALIASLAATEERGFLSAIKKSLKDADPDVRIASVWSLVEFQDFRSLNLAASMLRDPVERVRKETARAFGSYGSEESLKRLKDLLFDENEIEDVKAGAIQGLGFSESLSSIDILIERLAKDEELTDEIIRALAGKNEKDEIARIIENFKDASPALREKITAVFKEKKEAGEPAILEVLREDIASLKPFVAEILEATGHVEYKIRKLSHRDPAVRRDSAEFLSLVGTKSAFRGMVLAARDPDDEVRVKVIRALEKLETKEGNEILKALENDPDKRVRKYTLWALERLKAKTL